MQSGWPSPRLLLDDPHSVESLSDLYHLIACLIQCTTDSVILATKYDKSCVLSNNTFVTQLNERTFEINQANKRGLAALLARLPQGPAG